MKKRSVRSAAIVVAVLALPLLAAFTANAQGGPAVKIVLPERFRVLSQQLSIYALSRRH